MFIHFLGLWKFPKMGVPQNQSKLDHVGIEIHGDLGDQTVFTESDDGKIETGKPNQCHGQNHGFPVKISQQNQSIDYQVSIKSK